MCVCVNYCKMYVWVYIISTYMGLYKYTFKCVCVYIYIYIYIERERECVCQWPRRPGFKSWSSHTKDSRNGT